MSFFNESTSSDSRQQPKRAWGLILTSLATLGLVLAMFLPAPYVIEKPGPTFNVLGQSDQKDIITVSGAQTYKTDGNLNLLTVSVVGNREQTPGWLELLLAWLDPAQFVSKPSVNPADADRDGDAGLSDGPYVSTNH